MAASENDASKTSKQLSKPKSKDQIELDKYNRANAAASAGGFFGIRRVKFVPRGTVYPK